MFDTNTHTKTIKTHLQKHALSFGWKQNGFTAAADGQTTVNTIARFVACGNDVLQKINHFAFRFYFFTTTANNNSKGPG